MARNPHLSNESRVQQPPRRHLVLPHADYWFQAGKWEYKKYSPDERFMFLESAINSLEGNLIEQWTFGFGAGLALLFRDKFK